MEKFIEKLSLDRVQLDESLFNTISDIQNKDSIEKASMMIRISGKGGSRIILILKLT